MVIVHQTYEDAVGTSTLLAKKFVWCSLALAFILAGGLFWNASRRSSVKQSYAEV